jgi:hypothetical protein
MGHLLSKCALWIAGVILCVALGAQAALAQATPPPRATPTPITQDTPPPRSTPTVVETPSRPTPTSSSEIPPPRATPTKAQAAHPKPEDKAPESTPIATPAFLPVSGAAGPAAAAGSAPWWALAGFALAGLGLGSALHRRRQRRE